jgi:hypothetical protein
VWTEAMDLQSKPTGTGTAAGPEPPHRRADTGVEASA